MHNLVEDVVVGAMGAQNAIRHFKRGMLLITPGDREDIILAAYTAIDAKSNDRMAGIVLTGGLRPSDSVLKVIRTLPVPVLLAQQDSYEVASTVHDLTVKTRPGDVEKNLAYPRSRGQECERETNFGSAVKCPSHHPSTQS